MKPNFFAAAPADAAPDPQASHDSPAGHDPLLVTASAFLLLLVVVCADVRLGARFSVLLFYLAPIAWTVWFAGRNLSWLVAVFCVLARFGVEFGAEWGAEQNAGLRRLELGWSMASELLLLLLFTVMALKIQSQTRVERSMARSDGLTGLLNARAFESAVAIERERLRRHGHRPTLIVFDLDHLKAVNDAWGHSTGDEVLQIVARIVSANTRQIDACARLGGDEFAVLLPETDERGAKIVLDRLQRKIVGAMEGHEWPVTVSFGCLTCHADAPNSGALLRAADAALKHAKKRGKNQIFQQSYHGETA